MAPKAMKRTASKSAGGASKRRNPVEKKCAIIAPTIKAAESLPQPVRSIISDRLPHVFGTYKEERHPFQNTVSALVGATLKTTQDNLQEKITEATAGKAAQEAEGATLTAASNDAEAASAAADQAAADSKQALADANAALKGAKTALHDLETEVKTSEQTALSTRGKKEKLESLIKEFFTAVREGTLDKGLSKSSSWAAKALSKEHSADLEKEFIVCVERTYSKAASSWGTFDHIVDKELDKVLKAIVVRLGGELEAMEAAVAPRTSKVENAKATVTHQEEQVKAAEEVLTNAASAAKQAKQGAKAAASAVKQQQTHIDKAGNVLSAAEDAMATFQKGPLAAYTEVEAHKPPPPKPVAPAETAATETAAAPSVDAAMTAAPPAQQRMSPRVLPSPGVLFMQAAQGVASAVGLSPRLSASPRGQ